MTGATPASPKGSVSRLPRLWSGPLRLRSDRASRPIKAVLGLTESSISPLRRCVSHARTAEGDAALWHFSDLGKCSTEPARCAETDSDQAAVTASLIAI